MERLLILNDSRYILKEKVSNMGMLVVLIRGVNSTTPGY